jgi:deoxyribodipyrimidine photolyase
MLSPYFRFGILSPREAIVGVVEAISSAPDKAARESAQTWLSELIWREFYQAILYQFPHVAGQLSPGIRPDCAGATTKRSSPPGARGRLAIRW